MIFAIETSTSDLSLTLLNKNSILSHISIPIENELSEIIVPTIKMFLKDNLNYNLSRYLNQTHFL